MIPMAIACPTADSEKNFSNAYAGVVKAAPVLLRAVSVMLIPK